MFFWRLLNVIKCNIKKVFDGLVKGPALKFFVAALCFCILLWANNSKWEPLASRIFGALIMGATLPIGSLLSREMLQPWLKKHLLEFMAHRDNTFKTQKDSCKTKTTFSAPRKGRRKN